MVRFTQEGNMGLHDDVSKEYISDRFRFADLFNNAVFNGERKVDPDMLHEQDPVHTVIMHGSWVHTGRAMC